MIPDLFRLFFFFCVASLKHTTPLASERHRWRRWIPLPFLLRADQRETDNRREVQIVRIETGLVHSEIQGGCEVVHCLAEHRAECASKASGGERLAGAMLLPYFEIVIGLAWSSASAKDMRPHCAHTVAQFATSPSPRASTGGRWLAGWVESQSRSFR